MERMNVENLYAGLTSLERLSIINGCKEESRGFDYIIVNNFKLFVGLPVICNKSAMSLKDK